MLDSPEGVLEQFDGIASTAPDGWFDAARTERRCLLVIGESRGLDRFNPDRVDACSPTAVRLPRSSSPNFRDR